jgi:hypothetical protein
MPAPNDTPAPGEVVVRQLRVDDGHPLVDGFRVVSHVAEQALQHLLVIERVQLGVDGVRRRGEEQTLVVAFRLTGHLFEDELDHRHGALLVGGEDPLAHRPPRLLLEDVGEVECVVTDDVHRVVLADVEHPRPPSEPFADPVAQARKGPALGA